MATLFALLVASYFYFCSASHSGSVQAVYALLERLLPNASSHFSFSLTPTCPGLAPGPCFTLADAPAGAVSIAGTSNAELTAGLGLYLREHCNLTIGWPRGGGSSVAQPRPWPAIGAPLSVRRSAPLSWFGQVCTHSYTIVWYSWVEWEAFLDWMALRGINAFYAYTGQEEVQYKVFSALGVSDEAIRRWFNGPAFLTWSRGQNSHGGSIAGPLPRSWMQAQWGLQRAILARARELEMVPALPGFQGNVPWPLAAALGDHNITFMNSTIPNSTSTGWMSALDENYARVADAWMKVLCADFDCTQTHLYAADGFFNNGTGWGGAGPVASAAVAPPRCAWGPPLPNTYLPGCAAGLAAPCPSFPTLQAAQDACASASTCTGGVTLQDGVYQLRSGRAATAHAGETSWLLLEDPPCHGPDPAWLARGKAVYGALARADADAVWLWQGWAIYVGSVTLPQVEGFVGGAPPGKFVVLDMSESGAGQWQASLGGGAVPFIWTSLHTFGGNQGIKGNLSLINRIPFDALSPLIPDGPAPLLAGLGATPEGFDQNPAYFEQIFDAALRTEPLPSPTDRLIERAYKRYGLHQLNANVAAAWARLGASLYARDQGVSDATAVGKMDAPLNPLFWDDAASRPTPLLCDAWAAWGGLLLAAGEIAPDNAPYAYDLVDFGRETLAQLTNPAAEALRKALGAASLNASLVAAAGGAYAGLLRDLDKLLATAPDFLLGPWLAQARAWGEGGGAAEDCGESLLGPGITCAQFYEWNARVQLTTWYPVEGASAASVPKRDGDYARKQWSAWQLVFFFCYIVRFPPPY